MVQALVQAQAQAMVQALVLARAQVEAQALVEAQARARAMVVLIPPVEGTRNCRLQANLGLEARKGLPRCQRSHHRGPAAAAQGQTTQWMPGAGTGSNSSPNLCRNRLGRYP